MKKLKLDVEALDIESFDIVEPDPAGTGTVFANSLNPNCDHTADGFCLISEDGCLPWSEPPYCGKTYTCNTAMECVTA